MSQTSTLDQDTRTIAEAWFDAVTHGRVQEAVALMSDDVEFINYQPIPGYNTEMPWIGTAHGPDEVLTAFGIFVGVCEVRSEELVSLVVDGESAAGVVRERSTVRSTGVDFEIEFVQLLTIRGGKIVRWKSYTDPSAILRAINGGTP